MKFGFIGTCIGADPDEIHQFEEGAEDISFEEFLECVGQDVVEEINQENSVPIQTDFAVSFKKGLYQNRPTVMMNHSQIFHFYSQN